MEMASCPLAQNTLFMEKFVLPCLSIISLKQRKKRDILLSALDYSIESGDIGGDRDWHPLRMEADKHLTGLLEDHLTFGPDNRSRSYCLGSKLAKLV